MKVLYATDGLRPARKVEELLKKIADPEALDISILAVSDTVAGGSHDKLRLSKGRASWVVGHAANRLRAHGFIVRPGFTEGIPSAEILRLLERGEFDLALLGGGGRKSMGRTRLGRTARYVERQAPCSVVLVNDVADGPKGSVLVGEYGSQSAGEAVRALQEFADPTKCEMTIVSVVSTAEIARRSTIASEPDLLAAAGERARRTAERMTVAGFRASGRAALGRPEEALVSEGQAPARDLVAVGARSYRPLRRSVSKRIAPYVSAAFVHRRRPGRA